MNTFGTFQGPSHKLLCKYCHRSLSDVMQYYAHANSEHLNLICNEWVSCPICKIYLPTEDVLNSHQENSHSVIANSSDRLKCKYCHSSYQTSFQFYKHANKTHPELVSQEWQCCPTCHFFLPTTEALVNHKSHAHSSRSGNSSRAHCSFCADTFCSIQQYYKHANKSHLDIIATKWHPCQICNFYLPSVMALTNHKGRAHSTHKTVSKRVHCNFCSDTMCSLQQYYKHANKEHFESVSKEWHCCETCSFYLPSSEALTNHKGRAHSVRGKNPSAERVQCGFCPDTLCSLQQYYKHANKEHWESVGRSWHLCEVCNFYLPTTVALTNHKGRAHVPQKSLPRKTECSFCSEVFYGADEFHRHANSMHMDLITQEWEVHCKICWIYFPNTLSLRKHNEQFHPIKKSPEVIQSQFSNIETQKEERLTVMPDIKQML